MSQSYNTTTIFQETVKENKILVKVEIKTYSRKKMLILKKQKSLSKIGCHVNVNVDVHDTTTLKCSLNYKF